uniref:Autophagy-related protein 2 n=1 Tax=Trichuris muris TaxID=70415 RepID=A0A5S6QFN4_TRIMR
MLAWCSSLREVPYSVIKPFCTYLLNRYLGCYLQNKQINIEQLSVDIFAGKGSLKEVNLDVRYINEALSDANIPLQLFDGFIHEISLNVPWSRLLDDCCVLEVDSLELTLKASSMQQLSQMNSVLESFMASMTTSFELARSFVEEHNGKCKSECAKEESVHFEVVAPLVHLIDAVLSRMRLVVQNIVLRLEHYVGDRGIGLELRIDKLEFFDGQLGANKKAEAKSSTGFDLTQRNDRFVSKVITLSTVRCYTDWFVPIISLKNLNELRKSEIGRSSSFSVNKTENGSIYTSCVTNAQNSDSCSSSIDHSLSHQGHVFSEPYLFAILAAEPLTIRLQISRSIESQLVEVNATLGSAYLLVSPRCLTLLIELAQAFLSPETVDPRVTSRCGAMNRSDFEKIEKELKRKINSEFAQVPNIGAHTDQGDNWVGIDKFYPMAKADTSFVRSGPNLLDTSMTAAQGNFSRHPPQATAVSGSTRFKLIFNSVWVSLTYQDLCDEQKGDAESSRRKVIERFFKTSGDVMLNSVVNLSSLRAQCDNSLALDHIRFVSSPVVVDMTFGGQIGSSLCSSSLSYLRVVCRNCELVESLPAEEPANRYTELLVFDQTVAKLTDQPNVLLKVISGDADDSFALELNPCRIELDVTVLARMQRFVEALKRCHCGDSPPPCVNSEAQEADLLSLKADLFDALERDHPSSEIASRVRLTCSLIAVDFRIPVPNLTAETTCLKSKVLRDERLRVKLCNFCLSSGVDKLLSRKGAVSVDFASAYVQFCNHQRVLFNVCRCFSTSKTCNLTVNWTTSEDLDQLGNGEMDHFESVRNGNNTAQRSSWESMMNCQEPKTSWNPFSKTSVAYEGEALHIVGNSKELQDFRSSTSSRCLVNFCFNFDQVNLFLPSKELFEILFNRLIIDLPLWLATQLYAKEHKLPDGNTAPLFYGFQPDDVAPDNSCVGDGHAEEQNVHHFRWSLTVNVNHFVSILNMAANDEDSLSLSKFDGSGFQFYVVMMSPTSDPELFYFYASTDYLRVQQGADAQWSLTSAVCNVDDDIFGDCDSSMALIVKSTSPCMNLRRKEDACFSLAGKTHLSRQTELPCRHLLLTLGFRDLTVFADAPNGIYKWAIDLGRYLHLEAYPIEGYVPPAVVTELHSHCWNLSIQHRPTVAPLVVFVNVSSVDMATNLAMDAAVFKLHFIIEDSALYMLNLPAPGDSENELAVKDFVCLMRMGFFDFVVTCRGQPDGQPAFDFHARNDILHLHTCSDSAALLAVFLRCCMGTTSGDSASANDAPKHTCASFRSSDFAADLIESAIEEKFATSSHAEEDGGTRDNSLSSEAANSIRSDESFMLLENIPGSGIANPCGQPVVRLLDDGNALAIKSDHFALPRSKMDHLNALPPGYPAALVQYYFQQISIVWHLYGGCDFASPSALAERDSSSIPGGCFYSETGTKFQIGDGFNRDRRLSVDFVLSKVSFLYQRFPPDFAVRSRQVVTVQDFEITDRLPASKVAKLLSAAGGTQGGVRQSSAPMLCVRCLYVVPSADERSVFPLECCLKVSLVPLKLSIDQDTFEFMQSFFHDVDSRLVALIPSDQETNPPCEPSFDETTGSVPQAECSRSSLASTDPRLLYPMHSTYYRTFSVCPAVQLKLEYFGKRIDIDYGAVQGLLIGLSRLHCTELILKELDNRHGLLGVEKVILYALNEWLTDIRQNQLLSIVGSVGPLHNISEIAQGIRDLFWMPVDEFRRDGRIIRGLHRGAHSFGITTAAALLELTQKFFQTVHTVAEFAFDVVSPDYAQTTAVGERYLMRASPSPSDFREGLAMACKTVCTGFSDNAAIGGSRSEGKVRNRPILVASQATHQILGGIKSHFRADE